MARQVRIEYPHAFYHITSRGFQDQDIFLDDSDRTLFLNLLGETCSKTGWKIHAYSLLPNHYHFLLETPSPNLVTGMAWLQNAYTVRAGVREQRGNGRIFGDRYKSVPVEIIDGGGPYFRALLDYIHLNPVRSRLVQADDSLRTYPWTSLLYYMIPAGMRKSWHCAKRGLEEFGFQDTAVGRREFLDRLEDQARRGPVESAGVVRIEGQSAHSSLRRGWYFGSDQFRDFLQQFTHPSRIRKPHAGTSTDGQREEFAERILEFGISRLNLDEQPLDQVKKNDWRKALLAHLLTTHTTASLGWIADKLAMGSRSGVCRYANRIADEIDDHPHWKRLAERILTKAKTLPADQEAA